ncbi:MAG: xanthine dehydrogenase family protein molybdopterin-binding subunit [Desulfocurvibacter africanus]
MSRPNPLEIGRPATRIDGLSKAVGAELYSIDHYPDGLLWAGVKRAGIPHGRILAVHTGKAERTEGVVRVLTRKDVTGTNRQGIVHKDQPVLAGSKVRHCGDPVALVLAESREALARALGLVRAEIEPLPGVFDPEEALKPDAPRVHDEHAKGNVLVRANIETGQGKTALRECPVVVRGEYEIPAQRHAFLETENGFAWLDNDGVLHMTVSTQAPFRDRFEIAHALGLNPMRIHVVAPYLGGGFGGKDGSTVQCLLGLAAMHAGGRPVKMCWDREESFLAGYTRHAVRMRFSLGADHDGTLRAMHCRLLYDTGAYAHLGGEVLALGMEHAGGPYRIPNVLIEGLAIYTNNPVAGAMRGFGVAQATFGIERIMDALALKLSMDPLELRRKNALRRGDRNACGVTLTASTGIESCIDELSRHPRWRERQEWKRAAPCFKLRGVGVATVHNAIGYGRGLPDTAIAKVELTPEGLFRIYSGVADMGQGNATAYAQIAGEILCQDASGVEVLQPDTALSHPSGSATAGRTTYTFGKALVKACEDLRLKLLARAALVLFVEQPEGFALLPGLIRHLPTGRDLPLARLAALLPEVDRFSIREAFMPVAQDSLSSGKEFMLGYPHLLFSHAAHAAFVEVDQLTGKVEVVDYIAVTEAGRVLNPQTFDQQVQGAMAQGLGYALCEDMRIKDGRVLANNLATYIIPTALDVPDMHCKSAEIVEPSGPFGMKGVGEIGFNGPLPAVTGAVQDACGADVRRAPLTAENVLTAMRARRTGRIGRTERARRKS